MPTWRNSPSMPKVRASSATIGTIRSLIPLSRSRLIRMRTKAMVVETSRSPLPSVTTLKAGSSGTSSVSLAGRRAGR